VRLRRFLGGCHHVVVWLKVVVERHFHLKTPSRLCGSLLGGPPILKLDPIQRTKSWRFALAFALRNARPELTLQPKTQISDAVDKIIMRAVREGQHLVDDLL